MNVTDLEESNKYAIVAKQLTRSYGVHHALRGLDLQVKWGEFLAILGPNGAGKTTLLKILATLVKPSSGNVSIAGIDLSIDAVMIRRLIGVVTHQTMLYDNLSSYDNLRFYGKMHNTPNLVERINQLLTQIGLESRLHDRVCTLSRGMQQRLAIARALIHDPPILLLDEPGTGLDQQAISMLSSMLNSSSNKQRTVLMATHNLEQVSYLSSRFAILTDGKLCYEESKQLDIENLRELYYQYTGLKN